MAEGVKPQATGPAAWPTHKGPSLRPILDHRARVVPTPPLSSPPCSLPRVEPWEIKAGNNLGKMAEIVVEGEKESQR